MSKATPAKKKAAPKAKAVPIHTLKGLAENGTNGVAKTTYFKVDPDVVQIQKGFNIREDTSALQEHIDRIADTIRAGGQIPAIDVTVDNGKILVRDGYCRTMAARKVKKEGLPIVLEVRQIRGNDTDHVVHMLTSDQGKRFTPLEQGRGFLRLIKLGMSNSEIKEKTGFHLSTIANGLALAEAPTAVQQMLIDEKVSTNVALASLKKHGANAAEDLQSVIDGAGGKKVTPRVASKPKMKPAVVKKIVDDVLKIQEFLPQDKYDTLMEMGKDQLDVAVVAIPAAILKDLLIMCADVPVEKPEPEPEPEGRKQKSAKKKKTKNTDEAANETTNEQGSMQEAIAFVKGKKSITPDILAKGIKVNKAVAEDYLEKMVSEGLATPGKKDTYTINQIESEDDDQI